MKAIGGFFELEKPGGNAAWHRAGAALTSGRACLRAILELTRPSRVFVPFYICDAALVPLQLLGIPLEFYGLTESLDPTPASWPDDAAVLYVNYFDMKGRGADDISAALGPRAIIDDTQAFFRRSHGRAWSFNSARKFFGVPDGAYAYGPRAAEIRPAGVNGTAPSEHLMSRAAGDQARAYQQYVAAEQRVSVELLAPSPMSGQLLEGIDYDGARSARRRNFALLHERLAPENALPIDFALDAGAAPFCYPFLPSRPLRHQQLWQREIFVPRLWPEVGGRPASGFDWERGLAERLLPLPVDQRYDADDMAHVTAAVLEAAA